MAFWCWDSWVVSLIPMFWLFKYLQCFAWLRDLLNFLFLSFLTLNTYHHCFSFPRTRHCFLKVPFCTGLQCCLMSLGRFVIVFPVCSCPDIEYSIPFKLLCPASLFWSLSLVADASLDICVWWEIVRPGLRQAWQGGGRYQGDWGSEGF